MLCYQLGDFQPYIWRTDDYGKTWTRLTDGTNGIRSNEPTRVAREDPDREGLLFAGTEFGMYVSFDNGKQWQPLQLNLPATPVTDLKIHKKDLVLVDAGSRVLDSGQPDAVASDRRLRTPGTGTETPRGPGPGHRPYLFKPRDAYRFRYTAGFGGVESNRSNPADPQYPPAGAMIDYWVPNGTTGPITLDVVDGSGTVIRRFSSEARVNASSADNPECAPEMVTVGTRLPNAAGLNRFTWDLTLAPPIDPSRERGGGGGGGGRGNGPGHRAGELHRAISRPAGRP